MNKEQKIVKLTNVLVHCLAFQETVGPIEDDALLYRHKFKRDLKAVERECNALIDKWTDKNPNEDPSEQARKTYMGENLSHFYQVYQMVMNLSAQDINDVQNHLIKNIIVSLSMLIK